MEFVLGDKWCFKLFLCCQYDCNNVIVSDFDNTVENDEKNCIYVKILNAFAVYVGIVPFVIRYLCNYRHRLTENKMESECWESE